MILRGCWLERNWMGALSKYEHLEIAIPITAKLQFWLHLLYVQQHGHNGNKCQYSKYWVDLWINCNMILRFIGQWISSQEYTADDWSPCLQGAWWTNISWIKYWRRTIYQEFKICWREQILGTYGMVQMKDILARTGAEATKHQWRA